MTGLVLGAIIGCMSPLVYGEVRYSLQGSAIGNYLIAIVNAINAPLRRIAGFVWDRMDSGMSNEPHGLGALAIYAIMFLYYAFLGAAAGLALGLAACRFWPGLIAKKRQRDEIT